MYVDVILFFNVHLSCVAVDSGGEREAGEAKGEEPAGGQKEP